MEGGQEWRRIQFTIIRKLISKQSQFTIIRKLISKQSQLTIHNLLTYNLLT